MDQNSWIWKRKSTEKSLASDKPKISLNRNDEETLVNEKTDLEKDIKILNDKLSSAIAECNAKDEVAMQQTKIAQEAIAGWEKAEKEAESLKQELDKVLHQKTAAEERLSHLDAALKECMQQLRFVREQQESQIHDAVVKASEEFDKTRFMFNEKLAEAGARLAKLDAENTQLSRALLGKDKVIEDLKRYKTQVENDLNALMTRVESTEKEKASLRYEVRVLEKELDIRNEEREFNHRTAEVVRKQQQESAKRIAKLESECQRLRLLVRQRLPGPAAIAKMKNEVDMLGRDRVESRRRRSNPSLVGSIDFSVDTTPETPSRRVTFLTERLRVVEQENISLKEALMKKSDELRFPRTPQPRISSRISDFSSDDKASFEESWSEMADFRNQKKMGTPSHRTDGVSDTNLMDDFAEMEKLAVVSMDYPAESSHHSSEEGNVISGDNISNARNNDQKFESSVSISLYKLIKLVEGINTSTLGDSQTPSGYVVRVFQWKTSELSAILHQFVETCNDLLNGKMEMEQFAKQVASDLEWIMNHCFSLQDVSTMKEAIRNHFDLDDSRIEDELANREALIADLESRLQSEIVKNESFVVQLGECRDVIESLQSEMETMKRLKEDIETRLVEANLELEKACQKISFLENELESKTNSCEELELMCHELQIQLQSMTRKEDPVDEKQREKQLQNDREIMEATKRLVECEQTILNLGKQLEALASIKDTALPDKVKSAPVDTTISTSKRRINRRSSLHDQMLAEDDAQGGGDNFLHTNEDTQDETEGSTLQLTNSNGTNDEKDRSSVSSMAIVPLNKKQSLSFIRKLFSRKKKGNSKKTPFA